MVAFVMFSTESCCDCLTFYAGKKSFYLFTAVQRTCGGNLNVTKKPKYFTSERYPRNYRSGSKCKWTFTAPEGKHIRVSLVNLDTESCCDCLKFYAGKILVKG